DDCGVEVISFHELDSSVEGDEQPGKSRYKRLKEIRKAYKGKANIKDGDFLLEKSLLRGIL
ncbi:hypothetical protein Tco_0338061, partial [Tanacetum coccineum]